MRKGVISGRVGPLQLNGDTKRCLESSGGEERFRCTIRAAARLELLSYTCALLLMWQQGEDFSTAFTLPYIFIQFAHAGAQSPGYDSSCVVS